MSDSLVIIPTYNESQNVTLMIEKIFSLYSSFHILVVDDSSPDGTAQLVKELQKKFSNNLFLLEREKKIGLGAAYIAGFNWGLKKNYNFFFQMDCDFSHDPNDLIRLYNEVANNDFDMVVGSRYLTGVNVVNWPMSRGSTFLFCFKIREIFYKNESFRFHSRI